MSKTRKEKTPTKVILTRVLCIIFAFLMVAGAASYLFYYLY